LSSADHLVALDEGWSLWKWVLVRGAGFPAAIAGQLASFPDETLIPRLTAIEATLSTQRQRCLDLWPGPIPGGITKKAVQRLSTEAEAGRLSADPLAGPELQIELERLRAVSTELAELRRVLSEEYRAATAANRRLLREQAADARFREAVLWQNPRAARTGLDPLLREPEEASGSKTRQKELLVTSYLQRYCMKNDTIGFFGPVGWGTLGGAEAVRLRPGPQLLASRSLYYEHWCIDAIAEALSPDSELHPFLAPRRSPTIRVEGTVLHHPIERRTPLAEPFARLLALSDGVTPARALAEKLLADPTLELSGEDEVYALLADLSERRLLTWTLEVPTNDPRPEAALELFFSSLPEAALRDRVRAPFAALDVAFRAVAAASGEAAALEGALERFSQSFAQSSGRSADRREGQVYAGRTPLYEDCRRDLDFQLGHEPLSLIAPALTLILKSARWFTYTVGRRYREFFGNVYRALRSESGQTTIDFLRFFDRAGEQFPEEYQTPSPISREVAAAVAEGWSRVLELPPGAKQVQRSSDGLRAAVAERFAAPFPGWPTARHHSPDVMFAARGPAGLASDFLAVLGELHHGQNTLTRRFSLEQHPDAAALIAASDIDLAEPVIEWVRTKERIDRAMLYSSSERGLDIETGAARSRRPREQVIAVADLIVEERDGRLEVATRDGGRRFDILHFFGTTLTDRLGSFQLLPEADHRPRVTIDRLVIARERWQFDAARLPFAALETPLERFVGVTRWAKAEELPRHLFFKVPEEPKPCYLDLQSPALVEIFAKQVRHGSSLTLTEMLPLPDQLWLEDAAGRRYTAELRTAACDPEAWRPE
jgi:hypothetical protein